MLPLRPDLKIVLMSAALHADLFIEYFGHCPRIHIPGFTYPVTEFYLEDVLRKTGYTSMVPAEAIAAAAAAASESEGSEPTDPSLFEEFDEVSMLLGCFNPSTFLRGPLIGFMFSPHAGRRGRLSCAT